MAGTGSVDGEGFEAEFVCTSPAAPEYTTDACEGDGVLITDGGSVSFAAAELEPSQDCHWTVVCTGAGLVPQLTFSSFDTEAYFDFVYVYDSASPRGQAVEMHGTEIPLPLWATGSAGHMRYMSDWSVNGEGFDATVTCVEGVVEDGVVYTSAFESDQEDHESACDGGVVVGDGDAVGLPEGYSPSAQCSWLITCPLAPVVLTFVEMDIEENFDFIYLFDGESSADAAIGDPLHGLTAPEPLSSSGASMLVHFEADDSVERPGFSAFASCPNGEPTACTEGYFVSNHLCEVCPPGTENAAGVIGGVGDTSLGDTSCSAVTCDTDERVNNHMCMSCSAGYENESGEDASGPDTSCTLIRITGLCAGNTDSAEDIACLEDDGLMEKPDMEAINCGESCSTDSCCDPVPVAPPEVWFLWEAPAFQVCPEICGARSVPSRLVKCVKVMIFANGAVEREDEVLEDGAATSCDAAAQPDATRECETLPIGTACDDTNADTSNDVCTAVAGAEDVCQGLVALVSALTFDLPVESLELPDESASAEEIDGSEIATDIKRSLLPVLEESFGTRLTEDSITVLSIQAGSLEGTLLKMTGNGCLASSACRFFFLKETERERNRERERFLSDQTIMALH